MRLQLPSAAAVITAVLSFSWGASALYIEETDNGTIIAPCNSALYCYGDFLKAVELARPFEDSKTFVDMPALKSTEKILEEFDKLPRPLTTQVVFKFVNASFAKAGGELANVTEDLVQTNPVFLDAIEDATIKEFTTKVINIWPELTREFNGTDFCDECSSFIPLNRSFIIAGGRFREPYYWDSYWIIEGLLRTGGGFTLISKNIIENFLDFVERFGFVPNGARKYYLNRSQPPLLSAMVKAYVDYTNDTSVLGRAVPLLVKEHQFWSTNRTVTIKANGKEYTLNRYSVNNNQPRPESYREDYNTANNQSYWAASGIIYPENTPLTDDEKEALYANLASGAESGWDYSSRWFKRPNDAARDVYFPLRYINVNGIIPVDLNSILYQNELIISDFLKREGNETGADTFAKLAAERSEAMYAVMWNSTFMSYFDFNITDNTQRTFVPVDSDTAAPERSDAPKGSQVLFDAAQLYPFWTGAAPDHLKSNPLAVLQAYSHVKTLLKEKPGGVAATNFQTGQQWDEPNVWPPLQHILMQGLLNTPPTFGEDDPAYKEVQDMALRIAQRYLDSTFCTWYATGGETSADPKLEGGNENQHGVMFEKYSDVAINREGSGGEYEVVEGFGWTNGVLIWAVDTFGNKLSRPNCGDIVAAHSSNQKRTLSQRAVEIHPWDSQFIKRFS